MKPVLHNPGFEEELNGWSTGGWRVRDRHVQWSADLSVPHHGSYAAKIHHPQPNDTHLSQRIPLEPRQTCTNSPRGSKPIVCIGAESGTIGAHLSVLDTRIVSDDVDGTQDWQHREVWIRTPAHAYTLRGGLPTGTLE